MSDHALEVARRLARARRAYERAFEEFVEVAVDVADAEDKKIKQVDLVEASGFTREHIRRLVAKVRKERADAAADGREPRKLTLGGFPEL